MGRTDEKRGMGPIPVWHRTVGIGPGWRYRTGSPYTENQGTLEEQGTEWTRVAAV